MRQRRGLAAIFLVSLCAACGSPASLDDARVQPPPSIPVALTWQPRGDSLRDVVFADDGHGWAVGEHGLILTTDDGGLKWQPQKSNATDLLTSVFFLSRSEGWIAGTRGVLLRTTNGGERWDPQVVDERVNFVSVRFSADGGLGWAWGVRRNSRAIEASVTTLFESKDRGKTWALVKLPIYSMGGVPDSLFMLDARHAWAVVPLSRRSELPLSDRRIYQVLRTTDGGKNWSRATTQVAGTGFEGDEPMLHFVSEQVGWVAGGGRIAATTDGGVTWRLQYDPSERLSDQRLFFIDAQRGWMTGSRNFSHEHVSLMTTNGGQDWQPAPLPHPMQSPPSHSRRMVPPAWPSGRPA